MAGSRGIKCSLSRLRASISLITNGIAQLRSSCGHGEPLRMGIVPSGGALDLSYELYAPSESVVMCDCEYWARFTFGPGASGVRTVTVGGQPGELRGDWTGR